ncbi:MAG: DUF3604 domain-containing protein, partial [Spirochaetota bacterium]
MFVAGPSSLIIGQQAELNIAFVDGEYNPVAGFYGDLRITINEGQAEITDAIDLDLAEGWLTVPFIPTETGMLRIDISARGGLFKESVNPMIVSQEPAQQQLFWGDIHSHSHFSHDGVGQDPFSYGRNITRLDFYARTDHSWVPEAGFTHGLANHAWEEYIALADDYNEPGRFATLHAYEASFGSPFGHHNVYFRGKPGPLLAPQVVTLPEMWELLTKGEALTIPHHTGKFPQSLSWSPHDPSFRRNFELYSAHGLSETYDPEHPLAFEQSDFTTPSRSASGPPSDGRTSV